jgi:hypothetical protein
MLLLQCVNRRDISADHGWAERQEEGPILKLDAVVGIKAFGWAVSSTAHTLLDKHGMKVGHILVPTWYVQVLWLDEQSTDLPSQVLLMLAFVSDSVSEKCMYVQELQGLWRVAVACCACRTGRVLGVYVRQ